MRNSESTFVSPNFDIDDLLYFSDITISQEPILIQYQNLIKNGEFDEALELIQDSDYYGAWILNLLEDRNAGIYDSIKDLKKPIFGVYQKTEPTSYGEEDIFVWIEA